MKLSLRKWTFLCSLLLLTQMAYSGSWANGRLSGLVVDSVRNEPLGGATVSIPDLKLTVITNDSGYYVFKLIPTGTYLVQVHYVGFKSVIKTVTVSVKTEQNFSLIEQVTEESPVVVTGTSKAVQIKRNPIPITAVSRDYLANNLSTNIIDAIAKVPGVSALTTGPNVSKPLIRGLGYNRILTLYDGVRQEGQQWGDEHGIEVDQYGIDRIEIIKGPASLSYGSDALAGVVNLIPTPSAPEGKTVGNITTEYQLNNGLFGGSAMLGAAKNGIEWMGRISHKMATNYQNKTDGRVYGTAFKETDAAIALGLHRNWGYSHVSFSLFDNIQEIPDGSRDSSGRFTKQITEDDVFRPTVTPAELKSYSITALHQHVQHYRAYLTNNFILGKSSLAVNFGFQRSVRREFSHPENPYQDVPGLYLQLNTYSYDVKYHLPELSGWNTMVGVNGMYQTNNVTQGTEFVIPSYHQFDVGAFATIKKTFNKLDIAGGIRFDNRSFQNDQLYTKANPVSGFDMPVTGRDTVGAEMPFYNFKHNFSGASGSAGATYNFSGNFAMKANISRGYRAPNIAEISSNGVHPGTNIYQIGNDNFKPEFSFQQDVGFIYTSKLAAIELNLFNNILSNYIYNQRLDTTIVSGNDTYKFQQGKAQLFGGELSVDLHPIKELHFENSLSVVYGNNKSFATAEKNDSNRYLPFIPPIHGLSELRYNFESKKHGLVNCFAKVQLVYYGAQNRVYLVDATETATPGYTLFNAGAGIGIANKKEQTICNISVMCNNLFDVAYYDHLSRLKYMVDANYPQYGGIRNMGRNIAVKLEFPFQ